MTEITDSDREKYGQALPNIKWKYDEWKRYFLVKRWRERPQSSQWPDEFRRKHKHREVSFHKTMTRSYDIREMGTITRLFSARFHHCHDISGSIIYKEFAVCNYSSVEEMDAGIPDSIRLSFGLICEREDDLKNEYIERLQKILLPKGYQADYERNDLACDIYQYEISGTLGSKILRFKNLNEKQIGDHINDFIHFDMLKKFLEEKDEKNSKL
jgi:hypothetical protein